MGESSVECLAVLEPDLFQGGDAYFDRAAFVVRRFGGDDGDREPAFRFQQEAAVSGAWCEGMIDSWVSGRFQGDRVAACGQHTVRRCLYVVWQY